MYQTIAKNRLMLKSRWAACHFAITVSRLRRCALVPRHTFYFGN